MESICSRRLTNRSFIGLLLAQFAAAFNDHTIQVVATFYAADVLVRGLRSRWFDETGVITIVTASFIIPFLLFSPIAGAIADRKSKRDVLLFWKGAEVLFMAVSLGAFLLPHFVGASPMSLRTSAWLLVAVVFFMGTHSTFFVPAKYGIMPEILDTSVLSKGNGLLEGSSFVAQILGTAFGGYLYFYLKGTLGEGGEFFPGREWLIAIVLLVISIAGFAAAWMIERVPAANAESSSRWSSFVPLRNSMRLILGSRTLLLATTGIAFFICTTLFLRQTLFLEGESHKESTVAIAHSDRDFEATLDDLAVDDAAPGASNAQRAELRVALRIAMLGLGIGLGCWLSGVLAGNRVELAMVPIGGTAIAVLMGLLSCGGRLPLIVPPALVAVGLAGGIYIVPLYTLLQLRAPKDSKGSLVATSNLLNVTGGLGAVLIFPLATIVCGFGLENEGIDRLTITNRLFLCSTVLAALCMAVLLWLRNDLPRRAFGWITSRQRRRLRVSGLENVPSTGALVVVGSAESALDRMLIEAAIDRYVIFYNAKSPKSSNDCGMIRPPWGMKPKDVAWVCSVDRLSEVIELVNQNVSRVSVVPFWIDFYEKQAEKELGKTHAVKVVRRCRSVVKLGSSLRDYDCENARVTIAKLGEMEVVS